jgi:hypothetical protein
MAPTRMEDSDVVQICQNAMAMENATLQSFRSLFLTVEAVALGVGAVLISVNSLRILILGITIVGILITVPWYLQVQQRTRILDDWMEKIFDSTRGTRVSEHFENYKKTGVHGHSIRLWFDIGAPLCVVMLWVMLLWLSCPC